MFRDAPWDRPRFPPTLNVISKEKKMRIDHSDAKNTSLGEVNKSPYYYIRKMERLFFKSEINLILYPFVFLCFRFG